jgi:anti-sigma regulatory factor (Ser/Thr protein kinase)
MMIDRSQTGGKPVHRVMVTASADGVLKTLNEFEQFSRAQGLSDDLRRRFLAALDEILSNVARHGQPSLIQVEFSLDGNHLTVTIEDDAPPFNPLSAGPADTASPLEQRKAGGLGIELVRRLLESVQYARTGGRNRLTMTERLSGQANHS